MTVFQIEGERFLLRAALTSSPSVLSLAVPGISERFVPFSPFAAQILLWIHFCRFVVNYATGKALLRVDVS